MRLWLIERLADHFHGEVYKYVIRASTDTEAREIAADDDGNPLWRDAEQAKVSELPAGGSPGVLVRGD